MKLSDQITMAVNMRAEQQKQEATAEALRVAQERMARILEFRPHLAEFFTPAQQQTLALEIGATEWEGAVTFTYDAGTYRLEYRPNNGYPFMYLTLVLGEDGEQDQIVRLSKERAWLDTLLFLHDTTKERHDLHPFNPPITEVTLDALSMPPGMAEQVLEWQRYDCGHRSASGNHGICENCWGKGEPTILQREYISRFVGMEAMGEDDLYHFVRTVLAMGR